MFKNYRLLLVLAVYATCFALLYPHYQYIFDDDGIGYLSVTKHLANGDFYNGTNGFWSPLHSWLVVPLYKAGLNEFFAFRLSNGLIGLGILLVMNRLCRKLSIDGGLRTATLLVCIPIILSFAFQDLAADILLVLCLLIYTDLITEKDFFENRWKNILCGIIGCLSYLAKTYAFPFFMIHFAAIQFIHYRQSTLLQRKTLLLRNLVLGVTSCLLLALPWIIILYNKYHVLTFGLASKINYMSVLFPAQSPAKDLIIVPPAPLSCFWENPYYQVLALERTTYPSMLSLQVFIKQIRILLNTFMVALQNFHTLSFLSTAIIGIQAFLLLKRRNTALTSIFFVITILPLGYLLIHIETRFIWVTAFLLLISGIVLMKELLSYVRFTKLVLVVCWSIFFGSFLIYPVNYLKDSAGAGKSLFILADELKAKSVKGRFLSDINGFSLTRRLAYLTGSTECIQTTNNYTYDQLLAAARATGIDYFFYQYNFPYELEAFKSSAFYKGAVGEIPVQFPNLMILKMK